MTTRLAVAISWVTGKSLPGSGGCPAALLAAPTSQRVPLPSYSLKGPRDRIAWKGPPAVIDANCWLRAGLVEVENMI